MLQVQDGQCGMCSHFGEDHKDDQRLMQVRTKHSAPEDLIEQCGHPRHAPLHLMVTANSGCDGFAPAMQ